MGKESILQEIGNIMDKLETLAKHGFEFFIGGIGVLFLLMGILANVVDSSNRIISSKESLLITIAGLVCILMAPLIWHQKNRFKLQVYLAKLDWKKFRFKILAEEDDDGTEPKVV